MFSFLGADVNSQTWETRETALTLAASSGFPSLTQLLVEHGADVNAGYSTALMEAAQEGHLAVVKILLASGANPNIAFTPPKNITVQQPPLGKHLSSLEANLSPDSNVIHF